MAWHPFLQIRSTHWSWPSPVHLVQHKCSTVSEMLIHPAKCTPFQHSAAREISYCHLLNNTWNACLWFLRICNYLPLSPEQRNLTVTLNHSQNVNAEWRLLLHGTDTLSLITVFAWGKTILSHFRGCDYRRGMDWMIGFIGTLYAPFGTTGNYILYSSLLQTLASSVYYSLHYLLPGNKF
jgi:hypothetical protein